MEAELKALTLERGQVKAALTRFTKFCQGMPTDTTIGAFSKRLEANKGLYERFESVQQKIELMVAETENEGAQLVEREQFERSFFSIMAQAEEYIAKKTPSPSPSAAASSAPSPAPSSAPTDIIQTQLRLPTITLPKFDGDYGGWIKFRDTFESVIHQNASLSNVQRFHYLNSALTGNAARTIQSLGVSDANYILAWNALKNRYDNSRSLIVHHGTALLRLAPLVKDSPSALRELLDDMNSHILALGELGEPVDHWDTMIILIVSEKMDPRTKREWEKLMTKATGKPKLKDLQEFLEEQTNYLERIIGNKADHGSRPDTRSFVKGNSRSITAHATTSHEQCAYCQGSHIIVSCEKFKALDVLKRRDAAQRAQLCYNCLRQGHGVRNCTRQSCRQCNKKHHPLLHRGSPDVGSTGSTQQSDSQQSSVVNTVTDGMVHAVLSTAVVLIRDVKGNLQECRVLLDSGAQVNLITESFLKRLGLPRSRIGLSIKGIGGKQQCVKQQTTVQISSRHSGFTTRAACFVIPNITEPMPNVPLDRVDFSVPAPIKGKLADPHFDKRREIDMLIGTEMFLELLCVGQHTAGQRGLIFQKTQFGWILGGHFNLPVRYQQPTVCHATADATLNSSLEKFWEIEDHLVQKNEIKIHSADKCEQHFMQTFKRLQDGRYSVRIPFTDNIRRLGNSRDQAEKRFLSIERKLLKQPVLREQYTAFMKEYELLGHMSALSVTPDSEDTGYYLPHHAVCKDSSTNLTTKVRVVFDGSAKSSSGVALNDTQLVGPTVQDELFSIIVRFRKHKFVISADIEKMYRQVQVAREDRKYQRILWRSEPTDVIRTFELNTITYGTASAPFLATRVLHQVGRECADRFPDVSAAIINDFYVDDLLTGTDDISAAIQLKSNISAVLSASGFNLRKWSSNDPRILTNTRGSRAEIIIQPEKVPKTLGLLWAVMHDDLQYSITSVQTKHVTKRSILADIARIFDPLGLIGPVIVRAKLIMQRLWQLKTGWDESVSQQLYSDWRSFCEDLHYLVPITIPRRITFDESTDIELHGFSDASERAYGACIYVRSRNPIGVWSIRLVCAKSRVAPLKTTTLPRLELCGALLLAKLADKVKSALKLNFTRGYYWSDSTITLTWIRGTPNRWKTFVANRVSEIQGLTESDQRRHVISKDNPADLISRGISPKDLANSSLWWSGPSWLTIPIEEWPDTEAGASPILEERREKIALTLTNGFASDMFERFSAFTRLLRITAYCIRWVARVRSSIRARSPNRSTIEDDCPIETERLTTTEIENSRNLLVKLAQREHFARDIEVLNSGAQLLKSSNLVSLNPFLDTKGILRVGGRLRHAPIPYDHKHPIILPAKHRFTELIVRHEHERLLHAGCQHVIASLRTRYWPLNCKRMVKGLLRKCVTCFRFRPNGIAYIMGDLPGARVTPARPFYTCGVDYAGPMLIREKTRTRTTLKAYVCMFVCFVTKAVHIELATDLSTESFLNCLRRFISRRGRCHSMYSDNGSNFVGAHNELRELAGLLSSRDHIDRVGKFLADECIQWHLIPPRAPHFGGLWESAVKSAKFHVKRVIGDQRLTFEELYTLLTQIEACMNSRPLWPMSDNPEDLSALSPGHFLIGDALTALPEPDLKELKISRLNRFQLVQRMVQDFWQRWQRDYLHNLQQRNKWRFSGSTDIGVGMLALVKEDNLAPLQWRLGRITEIHRGQDGVVRVVTLRVGATQMKRPVTKICLLPLEDDKTLRSDNPVVGQGTNT